MTQAFSIYYGVQDSLGRVKRKEFAGIVTSLDQIEKTKSQLISLHSPKSVIFDIYQMLPQPFNSSLTINSGEGEYGQGNQISDEEAIDGVSHSAIHPE